MLHSTTLSIPKQTPPPKPKRKKKLKAVKDKGGGGSRVGMTAVKYSMFFFKVSLKMLQFCANS